MRLNVDHSTVDDLRLYALRPRMGETHGGEAQTLPRVQRARLGHPGGPETHGKAPHESEGQKVIDPELKDYLDQMKGELIERIRDTETRIVRVFMDFQERNETRDGAQEKAGAALADRLASVERRLREIEKKLLLEPPAA